MNLALICGYSSLYFADMAGCKDMAKPLWLYEHFGLPFLNVYKNLFQALKLAIYSTTEVAINIEGVGQHVLVSMMQPSLHCILHKYAIPICSMIQT